MRSEHASPSVVAAAVALAVLTVAAASGCQKANGDTGTSGGSAVVANSGVVKVTADEKGFSPTRIEVQKGKNVELEFTRTTDKTCADKVVFPDLNVTKDLPLNQPVRVAVPTDATRTLTFQCGMGMFKGSLVVSGS